MRARATGTDNRAIALEGELLMYSFDIESPKRGTDARRYRPRRGEAALTWTDVLGLWRNDETFRSSFIDLLRASPFACYRFETPAVNVQQSGRTFEFVLVDSPEIDMPPDCTDFQNQFDSRPDDVLVFDNLGGDATMIAPRPRPGVSGYAHIADFVAHAPMEQQSRLWQTVGDTLQPMLGDAPLWLSTAGGGVPWLHVRIDSRPKYYVFDEYRAAPGRRH